MFWGLIMEPMRRYTQKVARPFHISMACLDICSADEEPTQLMLHFEQRNYLLCTLQKGQAIQCALDLNFETGDEVVFATNGHSNVHLTGYLIEDPDMLDEEEGEEVEEEEAAGLAIESKKKKRKVGKNEHQPPTKKSKLEELLNKTYDSDEDDDTFALDEELEEEEASSDEDAEEEEGGEEEEDDEVGDEEDSADDEVSSLSEDEEEEVKPKENGVLSRRQRKKLRQNEVTQQSQSPKANQTPKGEKQQKTPKQEKQLKPDSAQKENKAAKGDKTPKGNKTPNKKDGLVPSSPNQQTTPQKRTLEGGVVVQDLKAGEGMIAKSGKMIQVFYEGRLKHNNKVFDQNSKGAGFKFRLGKSEVIKGWDVGVQGMKIGGKRRIICPPNMAYGNKGSPPVIPPNCTLVFDVELKNVL